jgi:hypothetical protein
MSDGRAFEVIGEVAVRGFLHPAIGGVGDGLVLTHGAGSNANAPLLVALAEAFSEAGWTVLRCDLPFRQARPTGPPIRGSAERDQQGLKAAVAAMRREVAGRVFLGGHSYGGRQATMLCAAEPRVAEGLVLLSYPLHPPQRPEELRTAHFAKLATPAMFVMGARDGFGSVEEVTAALQLIPARTELMVVAGGGHELMTKTNREEVVRVVVTRVCGFVAG